MPVLPVRDRVVFPNLQTPLVVGREKSIQAVKAAGAGERLIFVTAQRHIKVEDPERNDLYEHGTIAEVLQTVNLPDGIVRIRVLGRARAKLLDLSFEQGTLWGDVQRIEIPAPGAEETPKIEALRRTALRKFEEYAKKAGRIPSDVPSALSQIAESDKLADALGDSLLVSLEEKQDLIELAGAAPRLTRIVEILESEIEILNLERKIQTRVHRQIEKNQKEYYLNEQMRAIQKELKKKDDVGRDMDEFRAKIKAAGLPAEADEQALKEVERLEKMMPFSPEATVVRGYLEWILALPWKAASKDSGDVASARKILEEDHFGLEKPKQRLLEYMAVLKLTRSTKGPVLCFVGPPGVGKTSLAKSLARALGRKFVRISLGGVRDESEIRGHRRTYIGSMPGRILQALRKAGTRNPVVLLDEIDKMGVDWRGDPAAALLEVLDPEQNKAFMDHYLDLGFDLSEIIFIATANSLYGIPPTLQDRMEVIRFSAYTTDEKVRIANQYLLPKERNEHGLDASALRLEDETLRKIIHSYTHEAGVRELQRKIAQLCRKVAVELVENGKAKRPAAVGLADLARYLGIPEFHREKISVNAVGISTGLAWTDHGGETLTIEVTTMPGQGKVLLTGKLGSVMQESAQTAFSLLRSRAHKLSLSPSVFRKNDLHVHVPEGGVPKDGPSAGIAIATAIVSAFTGRAVRKDIAMTGEVTLRGRVLPIGGLKEKVLAAFRENVKTVLFPRGNEKDLPDVPPEAARAVKLVPVDTIDDVFRLALQPSAPKTGIGQRRSSSAVQRRSDAS